MRVSIVSRWLASLCLLLAASSAHAELSLGSPFTNNMVLQRGQQVPVWGWDTPGTEVKVSLGDAEVTAKAAADGKWTAQLPAREAGGPFEVKIAGSSDVTLKNVLIGEVWFCSGQSNMEWRVSQSNNAKEEIAAANHPNIRHIKIPHIPAAEPQKTVRTEGWEVCSPETVADFTAVGYFFARHLQQELDVPIGLIGCNWGGTRIEPWTPPVGFKSVPKLSDYVEKLDTYPAKKSNGSINHQSPLALYNGMVNPLVPYGIRGALWYQGESNNGEGMLYHEKMKALINGWRSIWNDEDLPFYFVQLAPFGRYRGEPTNLAGIWEAQLKTLKVPHTGMAVTVDISDLNDIHPRNKQDVGKRLALWALAKQYGKELVYSGPLYKSHEVKGDKVHIHFDHVGDGLVSRNKEPLNWFQVAGEDKEFHDAKAEIQGNTVVVHSADVENPTAVRFGWHQNAEPNLSNKNGLPASPFRTDSW